MRIANLSSGIGMPLGLIHEPTVTDPPSPWLPLLKKCMNDMVSIAYERIL